MKVLLTGRRASVGDRLFHRGDIAGRDLIAQVLDEHPDIGATIHMAAPIVVPESRCAIASATTATTSPSPYCSTSSWSGTDVRG